MSKPWSTQPITGAQHDAWMAEERRVSEGAWDDCSVIPVGPNGDVFESGNGTHYLFQLGKVAGEELTR